MYISSRYIDLFKQAQESAKSAYAPYSNFRVGAAVLCSGGSVITGFNIENRSYGLTNCAERTAIYRALTENKTDFKAIAIAAVDADYPVSPCGACRQVISEFFPKNACVIFGPDADNLVCMTVQELFPYDALFELKKCR